MNKIILCEVQRSLALIRTVQSALALLLISNVSYAQKEIPLYEGPAPGSENWNWTEGETTKNPTNTKIVYNVTNPTLTVFTPAAAVNNGSAVIVVPGGGGRVLLFEKEGIATAKELVKKGVTAFVLKYRLRQSLTDDPWQEMMTNLNDSLRRRDTASAFTQLVRSDLQSAMKYIRAHAAEYKIDKERVGVIGFSAGAGVSLNLITAGNADVKPNFAAINYAVRRSPLKVPVETKIPLFIAAATDDQLAPVSNSIGIYDDWLAAGQAVEMHLYATGGHGLNGTPANTWVQRFLEWMESMGFFKPNN